MQELKLTNAKLKPIYTLRKITISKVEFQEGSEEKYQYNGILGLILTSIIFPRKKKYTIDWTSFGRPKHKVVSYYGGLVISW